MKIRFHATFSVRDAQKLDLNREIQSDSRSVYIEVPDNEVKDVLDELDKVAPHMRHSFISGENYWYVY